MPTSCVFQLDRLSGVYVSGECVKGRILLKTYKPKRVNAIYVILEGEAKVQWSISTKSETANYYGHQQYLYTRTNVFYQNEFRAGTHVYNFTLRIPPACPSTCKGPYGFIAYQISLTIDKPWCFNEVFRQPISVTQSLNLNTNPEYGLPIKDVNMKYLCRWPCSSGPITSTLLLPYCGFVPTQQIPFYLEVENESPHYDIACVEASLRQHFIFMACKPFKRNYFTKSISKSVISERTLRLTKRLYQGSVLVPEEAARSTLNTSYIIFLHYSLQVKLKTGCFHYDIEISAPVVIGTVPLANRNPIAPVTRQPAVSSSVQSRDMATLAQADEDYDDTVDELRRAQREEDDDEVEGLVEDEPPSYDSCLPPSFSFATLGSQQTIDDAPCKPYKRESDLVGIHLPKFPGLHTFAVSAQAINMSSDSALNMNCYNSYGSLETDHTGRSLDTFGILSENDAEDDV